MVGLQSASVFHLQKVSKDEWQNAMACSLQLYWYFRDSVDCPELRDKATELHEAIGNGMDEAYLSGANASKI